MNDRVAVGAAVDELLDHLLEMDDNPKMILHEPYREISHRIQETFAQELMLFAQHERKNNRR